MKAIHLLVESKPKCGAPLRWTSSGTRDRGNATCKSCLGTRAKPRREAMDVSGSVKEGDIFYDSWGYNMTIVDFYKVKRLTPKGAVVVGLGQKEEVTGFLCGTTVPTDEEIPATGTLRGFRWGVTGESVSLSGTVTKLYGESRSSRKVYLSKWDGTPRYFNHCD